MVVEIAIIEAKPGEADKMREGLTMARTLISKSPGYRGSWFHQSIEKPERFVLYIKWDTVADHTEGFRKGPLFPEWRSHWAEYLAGPPDVLHFDVFAGDH
jgi:heme-degrading monooxygenase HmoA